MYSKVVQLHVWVCGCSVTQLYSTLFDPMNCSPSDCNNLKWKRIWKNIYVCGGIYLKEYIYMYVYTHTYIWMYIYTFAWYICTHIYILSYLFHFRLLQHVEYSLLHYYSMDLIFLKSIYTLKREASPRFFHFSNAHICRFFKTIWKGALFWAKCLCSPKI